MAGGKLKNGIIEYAGSNTAGWTSNLGIDLTSGVFKIVDAGGANLIPANPGWVTTPSTTAGQFATLKVETSQSFNDDSHASSDLTNLGFGLTETVDWAEDVPFFIYVVNRENSNIDGTDGNSAFFITKDPRMHTTPSDSDDIGDTSALPVNDDEDVILIMSDVTVANYTSLPCQIVGAFRMQWSTSTDDWTVQALGNTDGIGSSQLTKTFGTIWTMPLGQNGAESNNYVSSTSGGPTWAAPTLIDFNYMINGEGLCSIQFDTTSAGNATAGGGGQVKIHVPYRASELYQNVSDGLPLGIYSANGASAPDGILYVDIRSDDNLDFRLREADRTALNSDQFTDNADDLYIGLTYHTFG
jgi:hypothetical protein